MDESSAKCTTQPFNDQRSNSGRSSHGMRDIAKPYRRADNLRYWIKAAEIRFEIKLKLDVMNIVSATEDSDVWKPFQDTVMQWSKGVREELSKDWNGEEERKLHARAKSLGARSLAMSSPHNSPSKPKAVVSSVAVSTEL